MPLHARVVVTVLNEIVVPVAVVSVIVVSVYVVSDFVVLVRVAVVRAQPQSSLHVSRTSGYWQSERT